MIKSYNAKQWEIPFLLDGRKTVTRRLPSKRIEEKYLDYEELGRMVVSSEVTTMTEKQFYEQYPPYQPGDILYVRETWKIIDYLDKLSLRFEYEADGKISDFIDFTSGRLQKFLKYIGKKGWCPALFMPKEAARIWLKVTDVRVERLQDIKPEDLRKEGMHLTITPNECKSQFNKLGAIYLYEKVRENFSKLWNSTIKKSDLDRYGWDANPWVWVIEFKRCEKPEPCILRGIEPTEDKRPCIGYAKSDTDDEPCEMCKGCSKCSGNNMEE